MKKCSLALLLLVSSQAFADQDPFEHSDWRDNKITYASWEKIIVRPESYNGKIISIDGWFHMDAKMNLMIFRDKESLELLRPKTFLLLKNSEKLRLAYKNGDKNAWMKLRGRYVEITCRVGAPPDEGTETPHAGELTQPFSLFFLPEKATTRDDQSLTIEPVGQELEAVPVSPDTNRSQNGGHQKVSDKK
jgi:hypothetical protein